MKNLTNGNRVNENLNIVLFFKLASNGLRCCQLKTIIFIEPTFEIS